MWRDSLTSDVAHSYGVQQVRERHKTKGFEVEEVSAKITELMQVEEVQETDEALFPLVTVPDSQV